MEDGGPGESLRQADMDSAHGLLDDGREVVPEGLEAVAVDGALAVEGIEPLGQRLQQMISLQRFGDDDGRLGRVYVRKGTAQFTSGEVVALKLVDDTLADDQIARVGVFADGTVEIRHYGCTGG